MIWIKFDSAFLLPLFTNLFKRRQKYRYFVHLLSHPLSNIFKTNVCVCVGGGSSKEISDASSSYVTEKSLKTRAGHTNLFTFFLVICPKYQNQMLRSRL